MKILVVGSTGQLGQEIQKLLNCKDRYINNLDVNHIECITKNSKELDIINRASVFSYIMQKKPDIIINCAAYTNVDRAEADYEKAFQVNALGPRNLAIAAEAIGAKLIHVSTDYVFNGSGVLSHGKILPYREYDLPNPINVYGKTKLLGENYLREFCSKYFIIRTSWLYGENGNNFVKTIIRAGKEKGKLQVVNDQVGNPTNVEDLANHILRLAFTEEYGVYHCTGNGICSWYDFACKIVEYAEIDCIIEPVDSKQFKTKAKRPAYSCLDNMMLRRTIGDNMRNWEEALCDFIKNRLRL